MKIATGNKFSNTSPKPVPTSPDNCCGSGKWTRTQTLRASVKVQNLQSQCCSGVTGYFMDSFDIASNDIVPTTGNLSILGVSGMIGNDNNVIITEPGIYEIKTDITVTGTDLERTKLDIYKNGITGTDIIRSVYNSGNGYIHVAGTSIVLLETRNQIRFSISYNPTATDVKVFGTEDLVTSLFSINKIG